MKTTENTRLSARKEARAAFVQKLRGPLFSKTKWWRWRESKTATPYSLKGFRKTTENITEKNVAGLIAGTLIWGGLFALASGAAWAGLFWLCFAGGSCR